MIYKEINGSSMTCEQIKLYLERINVKEPVTLNAEYLAELQQAHISHIPFENIDIMKQKPLLINRDVLFEKIILNKRGGVCSELNTLYNWLLESLGYQVCSYSSRIIAQTSPIQAKSHRIIAVDIDGERYLTDVGFNYEHHRIPLKMEEHLIQDDGECQYKLIKDNFFGWLMMQNRPGIGWREKIGFTEDPCVDLDFVAATFFAENHPESRINKHLKVSLHIDGTFYAIRAGNFIKETGGAEKIIEPITSEQQEKRILQDVFDLNIGE